MSSSARPASVFDSVAQPLRPGAPSRRTAAVFEHAALDLGLRFVHVEPEPDAQAARDRLRRRRKPGSRRARRAPPSTARRTRRRRRAGDRLDRLGELGPLLGFRDRRRRAPPPCRSAASRSSSTRKPAGALASNGNRCSSRSQKAWIVWIFRPPGVSMVRANSLRAKARARRREFCDAGRQNLLGQLHRQTASSSAPAS